MRLSGPPSTPQHARRPEHAPRAHGCREMLGASGPFFREDVDERGAWAIHSPSERGCSRKLDGVFSRSFVAVGVSLVIYLLPIRLVGYRVAESLPTSQNSNSVDTVIAPAIVWVERRGKLLCHHRCGRHNDTHQRDRKNQKYAPHKAQPPFLSKKPS